MVVDANNNLIVYGVSYSSNFPVTTGAYRTTYSGNGDIIVSKFNATGTALLGSTFIGGSGRDGMNFDPTKFNAGNLKVNYGDQHRGEINVDAAGNIYVASCTASPDFPTSQGALQTAIGGAQDGCAFKLSSNCTQLLYSTFLGGTNDDACYSLDITPSGSIYVAGGTMSNNFPTTAGSLNTTYRGGTFDGFVAHIKAKTEAQVTAEQLVEALLPIKEYAHTITSDNGKEFAKHELVAQALDAQFYFATPYQSWERGTNENYNRLLRQYFPKKTSFEKITDKQLKAVQYKLNNRERKRLGFVSPIKYLQTLLLTKVAFTT